MSELNYSLQQPKTFLDKLALKKRLQMLNIFLHHFPDASTEHILDVGVTADANALSSNFFEHYYPSKAKIIALSNQDASFLEQAYPGVTFCYGDARQLPFANNSIDVCFSSAVIEHVGSKDNQQKMLYECFRVAKKGVFITTPNRWHPVEAHTLLPLIHWLPKTLHRKLLQGLGLHYYAQENNLNLLDRKLLKAFCKQIGIKEYFIHAIRTAGVTSNLMLAIKK